MAKAPSRALRREGRVPAVIYGQNRAPRAIHLEEKALSKALGTGHFMTSVVVIETEGMNPSRTLPKDVAFHPVTDRPIHVVSGGAAGRRARGASLARPDQRHQRHPGRAGR